VAACAAVAPELSNITPNCIFPGNPGKSRIIFHFINKRKYKIRESLKYEISVPNCCGNKIYRPINDLLRICNNNVNQSRSPSLGDVLCRLCGEDNETPIHVIYDCGHSLPHRLDTIGVHQMPEKNPEWDMESMVKFLQLEEITLLEDC
jgi:hypothetical protein